MIFYFIMYVIIVYYVLDIIEFGINNMKTKSKIHLYYKFIFPFAIFGSSFYKTDTHAVRLEAILFIRHELLS